MRDKIKKEWEQLNTISKDPLEHMSRGFVDQVILSELGDVSGKKILDVGCGNGDFAFRLHDKEALVTGVEISEQIIKTAQLKYPMINFLIHDFSESEMDTEEKYDVVILELVIMFVKDVDSLLANIKNILKPGGRIIVVILHPFLALMSDALDKQLGVKLTKDNDYFIEKVLKLETNEVDLTYFSRSLSWYVKQFAKVGYKISDITEPKFYNGDVESLQGYEISGDFPYIMLFCLSL
jgi:ubiquinone/menaquinone biosynthesis C-methylase UbiE